MEKIPIKKFVETDVVNITNNIISESFSVLDMFIQADFFVQIIMSLLLIMSIYSWTIILEKIFLSKAIKKEYLILDKLLQDHNYDIITIKQEHFSIIRKLDILGDIILMIYDRIYLLKQNNKVIAKETLLEDIELKIQTINNKVENKLYILGSISSSAPFIGLLGTVWGIMHSFQSIGFIKSATITTVAPGIAEALLATALGLIVAIPALIFNNKFYSTLEEFNLKFYMTFMNLLNRLKI